MSRLVRGPPFSGAAVAFIGRRIATLLLLAFEDAPLPKDARNPPAQSRALRIIRDGSERGRSQSLTGSKRVSGFLSALRHSSLAHVFDDALASLQEIWIVALRAGAVTAEGEPGIEGEPGLDFGLRFIE